MVLVLAGRSWESGRTAGRMMAAHPVMPPAGADGQRVPGFGSVTKFTPRLSSYATVFTVGLVPLAAALHVVSRTT